MATKQQAPVTTTRSVWQSSKQTLNKGFDSIGEAANVLSINMQAASLLSQAGKANALLVFQETMAELKDQIKLEEVKKNLDFINSI